jgi:hypothetical protein
MSRRSRRSKHAGPEPEKTESSLQLSLGSAAAGFFCIEDSRLKRIHGHMLCETKPALIAVNTQQITFEFLQFK